MARPGSRIKARIENDGKSPLLNVFEYLITCGRSFLKSASGQNCLSQKGVKLCNDLSIKVKYSKDVSSTANANSLLHVMPALF